MLFGMLALAALLALPAAAIAGPDVRLIASSVPGETDPGAQAQLTLTYANLGAFDCARKVSTQVMVTSPLSLDGDDSRIVDSICKPNTANMTFRVRVDPNAAVGSYPITLTTTYESDYRASYSTSDTLYLRVAGSPDIQAHPSSTTPVDVYAGDDFKLAVAVDNIGAFRADSLTLTLSGAPPIEVKSSTATQSLATLQPRASTSASFSLQVPKDAKAGGYPLTLRAAYLDENGQRESRDIPLSITVKPKALFDVTASSRPALMDTSNNPIQVVLRNTGTDTAKRVRAKLLPSFPFSTQGSVLYADEMKVGEEQAFTFYVDVDKNGLPGTYALDLSVTWENNDGDKFSDTLPVSARTDYQSLIDQVFGAYLLVWFVIAIALIAFAAARIRSKRRGKKEE